jgi:site-specific DNA recombinase
MTRAAIYRRVSTQRQAQDDRFSLEDQLERCKRWCEDKGYEVVADLPEVHSGADLNGRTQMTELRKMMLKQQIDVIVLTTLDRLSRDQNHQVVILYEAGECGVKIETTEESYDDSAQGRILRTFAGIFAEMERQKIRDRIMRGKMQRVRQGFMIPGNLPLYGYKWADAKKSRYIENPVTAPIARRIWNEAAAGKSTRSIALGLTADGIDCPRDAWRREKNDPKDPPRGGEWVYNTIRSILYNPAYWGEHSAFRWNTAQTRRDTDPVSGIVTKHAVIRQRTVDEGRVSLPDTAPALISPELAQIVHESLAHHKIASTSNNRYARDTLLRGGYAKCGVCGGNMVALTFTDGRHAYYCRRSQTAVRTSNRCTNTSRKLAKNVDIDVWNRVMTVLQDREYFESQLTQRCDNDSKRTAIEAIQQRIVELERQQKNIARMVREMRGEEGVEILANDLRLISKQKRSAQEELERLKQDDLDLTIAREQMQTTKAMIYDITQGSKSFTYEEKRTILYMLNIRVTIYPKDVVPRYTVMGGRHGELKLSPETGSDCGRIVFNQAVVG